MKWWGVVPKRKKQGRTLENSGKTDKCIKNRYGLKRKPGKKDSG